MNETASEKLNSMLKDHKLTKEQEYSIMEHRVLPVSDALDILENKSISAKNKNIVLEACIINSGINSLKTFYKGTWVLLTDENRVYPLTNSLLDRLIK